MDTEKHLPDHVDPSWVCDFDVYGDDLISGDPHDGFITLREKAPGKVFWSREKGGYWVVIGPDEIKRTLGSPHLFSNKQLTIPKIENPPHLIPESLDAPEHMKYRNVMMELFTPKAVRELETKIRERCAGLIDEIKDQNSCEFVDAIAGPLPVKVFMEIAGYPLSKYEKFRDLVNNFFEAESPEEHQ